MTKQLQATMAAILVMSNISMLAQTSSTSTFPRKKVIKKKVHVETATEREIRELREQMQVQQAEIEQLIKQNSDKDAKLATAAQDAQAANATAAAATAQTQSVSSSVQATQESVTNLQSTVSEMKTTNAELTQMVGDNKRELNDKIESPLAIHYKGVTITPGGFFAAESVYRTRSLNSDINTPFNATPFPGAANAHVSEFNATGRQSRLSGLVEGKTDRFKLTGYFETDFLNAGASSNNNESNSYALRQRQIWGQVATNSGFKFTGGQMWSLVTETARSTDNRTEVLPNTVDPQYHVGFSWARQYGVRLQQILNPLVTVAMSVEGSQTTFAASNAPTNFFLGGAGNAGGLFNPTTNYSNNVSPDVIVKAAFDPHFGHFEVGGIASFFRDRYYPNAAATTASAAGATNDTKFGGGVIGNARFNIKQYAQVGFHAVAGDGVGRYGTVGLPDTTVHPDGTLEPLRSYQGLFSLETHPSKKLDVYAYIGGEYVQRTNYVNAKGVLVGYAPVTINNASCGIESIPPVTGGNNFAGGNPYASGGSCGAATRLVNEDSLGYTYKFYNGPKGRVQYQIVYSYLTKLAWTGVGGAPKATNNMVFTSFRYYLP